MNTKTMNLTEEMEVRSRRAIPAWLKLIAYTGLGALTWQGAMLTYEQAVKTLTQAKYAYISGVISDELDGKGFKLSPDLRKNDKAVYEDMHDGQLRMALWTLSIELQQCQGLLSDINSLSNNIQVVRDVK